MVKSTVLFEYLCTHHLLHLIIVAQYEAEARLHHNRHKYYADLFQVLMWGVNNC